MHGFSPWRRRKMFCTNHKQDALKNLMSLNYLFEPGTVPPKDVSVYGFVMDSVTGKLETIKEVVRAPKE